MTIEEMVKLRKEAEEQIQRAIEHFQNTTGVRVEAIDYERAYPVTPMGGPTTYIWQYPRPARLRVEL